MTISALELAPRPLPRSVRPFPGEIMSSYLGRLAYANHLDADALRRYITGSRRTRIVPVDRLAIITSVPVLALEYAVADLRNAKLAWKHYRSGNRSIMIHPQVSGLACQLCAATRGATRPVMCWRNAEKIVCLRHRRWIGITDSIQPSLDRQSDTLKAHRQHLRLVRRFGRDNVTAAFTIAADICLRWHGQREHDADLARRLEIFHGRDWRVPPYARPLQLPLIPRW
jgi:TniQ